MGILRKIKNYLPPSSRSFHAFRETQEIRYNDESVKLDKLSSEIASVNKKLSKISLDLNALCNDLDAHDSHMKMFAWEFYKKSDEDILEAKKRFFRELPKATGSKRLIQLACVQLLKAFNEICRDNNINYWAGGGTLIGAVRHNGFIPWDDDVDLSMMRSEVARLESILKESSDYKLSVVYDPYVICRQIRFMFKDENIPCFLDIFPFDYSSKKSAKIDLISYRDNLMKEVAANPLYTKWLEKGCIDKADPLSGEIVKLFKDYISSAEERGLISFNKSEYIVRGIDNFNDPNGYHWSSSTKDLFPLVWENFEDTAIAIPSNSEVFLEGAYGDIFALPKDINSHFDHVADAISDYSAVHQAITEKLKENAQC